MLKGQPWLATFRFNRSPQPLKVLGDDGLGRTLGAHLTRHFIQQVPHRSGVPGDPVEDFDSNSGLAPCGLRPGDIDDIASCFKDPPATFPGHRRQRNHLLPQGLERLNPDVQQLLKVAAFEHVLKPRQHATTSGLSCLRKLGLLHGLENLVGRPVLLGRLSSHVPNHDVVELHAAQGHSLVQAQLAGGALLKDFLRQAGQGHTFFRHALGDVDVATSHLLAVDAHVAHDLGSVPGSALAFGNVLHGANGPGLLSRGCVDLPGQDGFPTGPTSQVQAVVTVDDQQLVGLWVAPDADNLAEQRVIGLGVLQGPGDTTLAFALASSLELQPDWVRANVSHASFPHLGITRHDVAALSSGHSTHVVGNRAAGLGYSDLSVSNGPAQVCVSSNWIRPWIIEATLNLNAFLFPERSPGAHVHVRLGNVRRSPFGFLWRWVDTRRRLGIHPVCRDWCCRHVDGLPSSSWFRRGLRWPGCLPCLVGVDDCFGSSAQGLNGDAYGWA